MILDDASSLQDRVRVSLDAFRDTRRHFGPMSFLPGAVLPQAGDRCVVVFTEKRAPVVVWWGTEEPLPPVPDVFEADLDALAASIATSLADKQPLDADLTAIAALATTAFGRSFLPLVDAAAARTLLGLVIGTNVQAQDADLAAIAALATTAFGRSLLTAVDAAGGRALMGSQASLGLTLVGTGSTTWDPPSLATGATTPKNVTVNGATAGDFAQVSLSTIGGIDVQLTGFVSVTDTVRAVLTNRETTTQDIASGTLRAIVTRL